MKIQISYDRTEKELEKDIIHKLSAYMPFFRVKRTEQDGEKHTILTAINRHTDSKNAEKP